ncbi:MAG: FixH family protein [Ginsengibacter sp.]
MNKVFLCLMAISLVFASCKKENVTPEPFIPNKIKLAVATFSNAEKITLWANDSLKTGFQTLYLTYTSAEGNPINNASIKLNPVMDMGTMKHSSPVVQPVYNPITKMYEGGIVFTMASGMNAWVVNVTAGDETRSLSVKINNSALKTTGSYVGTDGINYQVSLVPSKAFFVGLNDFQILINKKETMMSFPAVDNLEIVLSPEMPSMGHSSPNNVNPVNTENGYYKGKVNFTMTGNWRLHFKLKNEGVVVVEDATIDILF